MRAHGKGMGRMSRQRHVSEHQSKMHLNVSLCCHDKSSVVHNAVVRVGDKLQVPSPGCQGADAEPLCCWCSSAASAAKLLVLPCRHAARASTASWHCQAAEVQFPSLAAHLRVDVCPPYAVVCWQWVAAVYLHCQKCMQARTSCRQQRLSH